MPTADDGSTFRGYIERQVAAVKRSYDGLVRAKIFKRLSDSGRILPDLRWSHVNDAVQVRMESRHRPGNVDG